MGADMETRDERAPVALHGAAWRDALLGARLDLADALAAALATERLGPRAYLRWIVAERALCATGAATLQAMAAGEGALAGWAGNAAATLAAQAAMAAADVRRTDGMATAAGLVAVDHWCDHQDRHARPRPGLALGAIAAHAAATGGPAHAALSAVLELPFLSLRGATYLVHRQLQARAQGEAVAALWTLADARLQRELVAGATHAATLYRGILHAAFDLPAPTDRARWRWPGERAG